MSEETTETVMVIRFCRWTMKSAYDANFKWPKEGPVSCTDWNPFPECGHGLHGWLEGRGQPGAWTHMPSDEMLVVEVLKRDLVSLDGGGKVKFPKGTVVHCGTRASGTTYMKERGHVGIVYGDMTVGDGETAEVGAYGTAKAGKGGTAIAGDYGKATAGEDGYAKAGVGGTATAGKGGKAFARGLNGVAKVGDYGTAEIAGRKGTATAGDGGKATAGDWGHAKAGKGGMVKVGYGGIVSLRKKNNEYTRKDICTWEKRTFYTLDENEKIVPVEEKEPTPCPSI